MGYSNYKQFDVLAYRVDTAHNVTNEKTEGRTENCRKISTARFD